MSERISPNVPPSYPRWGLTPRGRKDEEEENTERGRSKRDKEITCEHMALTAYEMYNYYLQRAKRGIVAKSSRQSFLFICSRVHLADVVCCQFRARCCKQPGPGSRRHYRRGRNLRKFWRGLLSAVSQYLLKISPFPYRPLFVSHRGIPQTWSYLTTTMQTWIEEGLSSLTAAHRALRVIYFNKLL